jgi:hypothetical protein
VWFSWAPTLKKQDTVGLSWSILAQLSYRMWSAMSQPLSNAIAKVSCTSIGDYCSTSPYRAFLEASLVHKEPPLPRGG